MRARVIALAVATSLMLLPIAHAGQTMKPGMWRITNTTTIEGMGTLPAHTISHCFRPEDVKSRENVVKQSQSQGCTVDDLNTSGNTTHWKVSCDRSQGHATGEGTFTMSSPTAYNSKVHMTMSSGGHDMSMKMDIAGRWWHADCN